MSRALEAVLRRQRLLTVAALVLLVLLAWAWLLLGAGMAMPPHAALDPFPHRDAAPAMGGAMDMAPAGWAPAQLLLAFSMWWVMMVAMMLPAAAPVILLYARAALRSDAPDANVAAALDEAMRIKPERHHFRIEAGAAPAQPRHMSLTGG